MRHVVVTRGEQIVGVLRVNADLPHEGGARVSMGALALRKFTIAPQRAAMFDVISRLSRCNATNGGRGRWGPTTTATEHRGRHHQGTRR